MNERKGKFRKKLFKRLCRDRHDDHTRLMTVHSFQVKTPTNKRMSCQMEVKASLLRQDMPIISFRFFTSKNVASQFCLWKIWIACLSMHAFLTLIHTLQELWWPKINNDILNEYHTRSFAESPYKRCIPRPHDDKVVPETRDLSFLLKKLPKKSLLSRWWNLQTDLETIVSHSFFTTWKDDSCSPISWSLSASRTEKVITLY